MNASEFQFRLINTFLTTCLVLSALLAWFEFRSYRDSVQDQNRRVYTMHLYDEWRTLLDRGDARITLEMVRSGQLNSADLLQGDRRYSIRLEGVDEALQYEEVLQMRQHIISVLNLFEQVAVAAQAGVGDVALIRDIFGAAITDHYAALVPFIDAWTTSMGRAPAWVLLDDAIIEWRSQ